MLQALKHFKGLDHRCQWVAENKGVTWINDSKGTNIGATIAAIEGIGSDLQGKMVLLLGGDGKGADFTELLPFVKQYCRAIIVMGVDAPAILAALNKDAISYLVDNMQQAVQLAKEIAQSNDVVLLSPACSSLDQYQHFGHRGDTFMTLVKEALGE
jgi:UDP-N-acetylmuramoylalanine--D-glutamate ligase